MFQLKYLISGLALSIAALNSVNGFAAEDISPKVAEFLQQGHLEAAQKHLDSILVAECEA